MWARPEAAAAEHPVWFARGVLMRVAPELAYWPEAGSPHTGA
jgi:hypothetical protein